MSVREVRGHFRKLFRDKLRRMQDAEAGRMYRDGRKLMPTKRLVLDENGVVDWGQVSLQALIDKGLNAFGFELISESWADLQMQFEKAKMDAPKGARFKLRTHKDHGKRLIEISIRLVPEELRDVG